MSAGKTAVFTVFTSAGYSGAGGVPSNLLTNEELLRRLEESCKETTFTARDLSTGETQLDSVLRELEAIQDEMDGVLLFGTQRREEYALALTGLPTIVVYNLFEFMHIPYELYRSKGRILTACLDRRNVTDPSIGSSMFDDLLDKIGLLHVLRRMKESTIVSISPYDRFAVVDYKHLPPDYNKRLANALDESFGTTLVKIDPQEFYAAAKEVKEEKARETARVWLDEAADMRDTTEAEVVLSARMYLSLKALKERYHAAALTCHMRSLTGSGKAEDMAWPSLGNTEFQKHGVVGLCQDYPHIAATHLLALYLTGRPSMLGDLMIDPFNEVSILLHCGAPINPHGNDRVPYVIRSHAESPVRGTLKPGSGAGSDVRLPTGEIVSIWKTDVVNKRILVHTGTSVDGDSLYKGLDEIMCRTKLVVKTEARKVQSHFSMEEYGLHRAATYGDLREKIRNVATLIGFDVVEEDRQ